MTNAVQWGGIYGCILLLNELLLTCMIYNCTGLNMSCKDDWSYTCVYCEDY